MIPMVPFSPFAQLGAYANEDMLAIVALNDQFLSRRKTDWSLKELQSYAQQYLQIMQSSVREVFCAVNIALLQKFCNMRSDDPGLYLCVSASADMLQASVESTKAISQRAIRRGMYHLTKRVFTSFTNYRMQIAKELNAEELMGSK
jgi:hypothetical protein